MNPIPAQSIKQLFTEARTYNDWLAKEVSDQTLYDIYELMKWGPTSANLAPARIIFIKNSRKKEKLMTCLSPTNVAKVQAAPVTAIIASDKKFYEHTQKLFPHAPIFEEIYASNHDLAAATAFRNSSMQGAYFILSVRALGLDCGPMSGFDHQKLDKTFFTNTNWQSNFICNIGYGDTEKLSPRLPRLSFDEACLIF